MIIVDISVPVIGRNYNFRLEETAPIRDIIPEIAEVICQKEGYSRPPLASDLELVLSDMGQVLDKNKTLSSYGAVNGSGLMLI